MELFFGTATTARIVIVRHYLIFSDDKKWTIEFTDTENEVHRIFCVPEDRIMAVRDPLVFHTGDANGTLFIRPDQGIQFARIWTQGTVGEPETLTLFDEDNNEILSEQPEHKWQWTMFHKVRYYVSNDFRTVYYKEVQPC